MQRRSCQCGAGEHACRLVVLTGGPGAGKTAVLEVVRRHFCEHIAVLPEAASVVFGGGFPRADGVPARRAAQRAIYRVQVELERMVLEERVAAVALCDRGTLDGLAYWPGPPGDLFGDVGMDPEAEMARYAAVIHLRTPPAERGYNHRNPLRDESAPEAARLDERVAAAWSRHPRRFFVESADDFLDKLAAPSRSCVTRCPHAVRGTWYPRSLGGRRDLHHSAAPPCRETPARAGGAVGR